MNSFWDLLLALGFLILLFIPLERAFPAKRQKILRPGWRLDLWFLAGQYLLWNGAVIALLARWGHHLQAVTPTVIITFVSERPWWQQALAVVLLSDLIIYWGHRLQHNVPFLWRFHSVHHSAEHLDWLAAHREHPVDTVYTMGLINLPAFMLGFPLETLAGLAAFRGLWAIYIHSNVRLPIGPLRWIIGAPELHHWHHDKDRFAGNYANISPLMDILFGTYRCPDHLPERYGIHGPQPQSYIGQMLHPFGVWKLKKKAEEVADVDADVPVPSNTLNILSNEPKDKAPVGIPSGMDKM